MTFAMHNATRPFPDGKAAGSIASGIVAGINRFAAGLGARLRRAHTCTELSDLSDHQLADIGVNRSAIEPTRPVIEVDARLMRTLMSMR